MKYLSICAGAMCALLLGASAVQAATNTVYNTELGTISPGTTTTDATGTRSTNPGGTLAGETPAFDQWQQQNVRSNGEVGITTDYARSGNGSVSFFTDGSVGSKADVEYYFSQSWLLSDLDGASFDWYKDSASTGGPAPSTSFRFQLATDDNLYAGYLIYETYSQGANPLLDSWQTAVIDPGSTKFWSNNANVILPTACANRQSCLYTMDEILSVNDDLKVIGLSMGFGSGWTGGTQKGAGDNVSITVKGQTNSWNFEKAAVPEPATWALLISGFGLSGTMLRRRRSTMSIA